MMLFFRCDRCRTLNIFLKRMQNMAANMICIIVGLIIMMVIITKMLFVDYNRYVIIISV